MSVKPVNGNTLKQLGGNRSIMDYTLNDDKPPLKSKFKITKKAVDISDITDEKSTMFGVHG